MNLSFVEYQVALLQKVRLLDKKDNMMAKRKVVIQKKKQIIATPGSVIRISLPTTKNPGNMTICSSKGSESIKPIICTLEKHKKSPHI